MRFNKAISLRQEEQVIGQITRIKGCLALLANWISRM